MRGFTLCLGIICFQKKHKFSDFLQKEIKSEFCGKPRKRKHDDDKEEKTKIYGCTTNLKYK